MKKIIVLALLALPFVSGCGYTGRDIEAVGQVKRVVHNTPLICGDYIDIDLSLGVMRNGTGSMSTQHIWVTVPAEYLALAKSANDDGRIVRVTYDHARFVLCEGNMRVATKFEAVP